MESRKKSKVNWGAVGAIAAVIAIPCTLFFPEVRRFVGLEKPASVPTPVGALKPEGSAPPNATLSASTPTQESPSHRGTHKANLPPKPKEPNGDNNGSIGGGVTQGPCSITQIGGSNNQATTNCAPPPPPDRTLSVKASRDFQAALSVLSLPRPIVGIEIVGNDTDMPAFPDQVVDAFNKAGWEVRKTLTGNLSKSILSDSGMVTSHGEGLHCGATDQDSAEAKKALEAFREVGLTCTVDGSAFPRNGEVFVVVIGPKVRTN